MDLCWIIIWLTVLYVVAKRVQWWMKEKQRKETNQNLLTQAKE
jgi:uncharacterized membrane protein affecting hemolysin expression